MKMSLNKTIQEAQEKHNAFVDKQSKEFEELILSQQEELKIKQEELIKNEKESIEEMNKTIQDAIDNADRELTKGTDLSE